MPIPDPAALRAEILRRAQIAGPAKSICPSEVARGLSEEWRPLMKPVRDAAIALVREGRLQILRHGKPVSDLDAVRGVIRLRIAEKEGEGLCPSTALEAGPPDLP
jgi:hypothetical protein